MRDEMAKIFHGGVKIEKEEEDKAVFQARNQI